MCSNFIAGVTASAAEAFDATKIIGDSVTSVQGQLLGILAVVVPAIVVVVGAIIGIKFGLQWIQKIRGN